MSAEAAIYNPKGRPVAELPTIFGYLVMGSAGLVPGAIVAADGTMWPARICTTEELAPRELGMVDGACPDLHDSFRAHYPDGYRTEFVSLAAKATHRRLDAALRASGAVRLPLPAPAPAPWQWWW